MIFKHLKKSIRNALRGIKYAYKHEQNFRIQSFFAVIVIVLMLLLRVRKAEMIVLFLLIFSVLTLELLNSALEKFVDILKPRLEIQVGTVKDIMAGMVFLVSIASLLIGVMIFWPYLYRLLVV